MHKFLSSIGFSKLNNKELKEILDGIVEHPDSIRITKDSEGNEIAELTKKVSSNMALVVRGEYNGDDEFEMEYYFPAMYGTLISNYENILIEKFAEKESYAGIFEDERIGVSIIFYLQNVADYLSEVAIGRGDPFTSVTLAGLSTDGKIILPVKQPVRAKTGMYNTMNVELEECEDSKMEELADEYYESVGRRVAKEDILSIVNSTFMPYGFECDQYSIIGTIRDFTKLTNWITMEEIYCINIECNDFLFDICINANDLLGEPAIGRRFKGSIWLQGNISS